MRGITKGFDPNIKQATRRENKYARRQRVKNFILSGICYLLGSAVLVIAIAEIPMR